MDRNVILGPEDEAKKLEMRVRRIRKKLARVRREGGREGGRVLAAGGDVDG